MTYQRTCSDYFAVVLIAAFVYPLSRQVSGALPSVCALIVLVGLPFASRFVGRIKLFTALFLLLAMTLELVTVYLLYRTTGDGGWVKYAFIGFLIWFVMLIANMAVHHEGRVNLDKLIFYAICGLTLAILVTPRAGGCPSGSICIQAAQIDSEGREQSFFEHPNELGLYIAGFMCLLAWLSKGKPWREKIKYGVLMLPQLYLMAKSEAATAAFCGLAAMASAYFVFLRPLINLGLATLIALLFWLQIFEPKLGMELSGQGSFWWRFVVADEVNRAIGHNFFPVSVDLFNIFNTWLHSKYLDIRVIFGTAGVMAFMVGALIAILYDARSLSATVLAGVVVSAILQPLGAFPGPFLLWAIMYCCIVSDEYRTAALPQLQARLLRPARSASTLSAGRFSPTRL